MPSSAPYRVTDCRVTDYRVTDCRGNDCRVTEALVLNYLAHTFLAAESPAALVGSLLGDFMAGVDLQALPVEVREGVLHHRAVDAFTDRHPVFLRSRRRIAPRYRHLRGVMVDVFYDHFLARDWRRFSPQLPLHEFTQRVYRALQEHRHVLSPRLHSTAPAMAAQDWLASYGTLSNVELALKGIGRRLRRGAVLADGMNELRCNYQRLADDFHEFFPELLAAHGSTARATADPYRTGRQRSAG